MPIQSSYCGAILAGELSEIHKIYHDTVYGFPAKSDDELFGRMLMEMNQAGLSWDIVLKKQESIKSAYANFSIEEVAKFDAAKIDGLMNDAGIIRMRAKIEAAVFNARKIIQLRTSQGSFKNWLDNQEVHEIEEWVKLFKKHFKFMGKETTKEFLMSTGYIEGAHNRECPVYKKIASLRKEGQKA